MELKEEVKVKTKESKDRFVVLRERFNKLDNGLKAALRRVADPDDLRDTAAFYRLLDEPHPGSEWLRVVFLLPWCKHRKPASSLGRLLAEARISETRVLQIARAKAPQDIRLLRRLVMQFKPSLHIDMSHFGWILLRWNKEDKRRIVEDYYAVKYIQKKKGA